MFKEKQFKLPIFKPCLSFAIYVATKLYIMQKIVALLFGTVAMNEATLSLITEERMRLSALYLYLYLRPVRGVPCLCPVVLGFTPAPSDHVCIG